MKPTAMYDLHGEAGGRMVEFAGFSLPVQYEAGVIQEHLAVRERAGLFDVSHMGEFLLTGSDSVSNLNRIFTNQFAKLKVGAMRYTVLCQEDGGCLDDLIVARLDEDRFLLIVNASNREKDAAWIQAKLEGDVRFEDISDQKGLVALQGPRAEAILRKLTDRIPDKGYRFIDQVTLSHGDAAVEGCLVSRTGYTGEDGFELMCDWDDSPRLWTMLLAAGQAEGLQPAGLGARDTLRLEAGMPLYGHELTEQITPVEAGLDFAVKPKDDVPFVGQEAILAKGEPQRVRVGLRITGKGIAREASEILKDAQVVGSVTSGTHSPSLGYPIAMAYIDRACSEIGTKVQIQVRKRQIDAEIVALPFYKRSK